MEEIKNAILAKQTKVTVNGVEFTRLPSVEHLNSDKKRTEAAEEHAKRLYKVLFD